MVEISVIIPKMNGSETCDGGESAAIERIVVNASSSYGKTMNDAIRKAKGEYIAFLYPKDHFDDSRLLKQVRAAKKDGLDVLCSGFLVRDGESDSYRKTGTFSKIMTRKDFCPGKDIKSERELVAFLSQRAGTIATLFKREFLISSKIAFCEDGTYDLGDHKVLSNVYQDVNFGFRAFASADKVRLTNDAYLYHTENEYDIIAGFDDVMRGVYEHKDAEHWNKEYVKCVTSPAYKVGRYVTFLPVSFAKMTRSIIKHGLKHTLTVSLKEFLGR